MSFRRMLAWWAWMLATLSGCVHVAATPTGVIVPQPHPSIRISRTTTSHQTTIAPGETRQVRVRVSKPIGNGSLTLYRWTGGNRVGIPMHDDGRHGDALANDGEWYAEYTVPASVAGEIEDWVSLSIPGGFGRVGNHETVDLPVLQIVAEDGDE